jgi:hypothetical protein
MKVVMMPWKSRLVTHGRPDLTRFDVGPFCYFLVAMITISYTGCRRVDQGPAAVQSMSDRSEESATAETTSDTTPSEVATTTSDSVVSPSEAVPMRESNSSPATTAPPIPPATTISGGDDNTVAAVPSDPSSAGPPLTRPIPAEYSPPVEPPSRPRMTVSRRGELDLTFDDLEFPIEPDQDFERSMLTEKVEGYDGKQVTIRGFILPGSMFQQTGSKEFVLVRDNQQCCFGPTAYVYHNIQIKMAPGQTADFTIRPITVTGKFTIEPWIAPNGKCYSVFQMVATSAK